MIKWLCNKIVNAGRRYDAIQSGDQPIAIRSDDSPDIEGLRFNVMSANGGTIVQLRQYDRKTDRHNYITHVIPDGDPIAERIGEIVSLEILRS